MFVSSVTVYGVRQLLMRDDLAGGCREGARCREPASPLNLANRLAVCPPNPHRWQMEAPGVQNYHPAHVLHAPSLLGIWRSPGAVPGGKGIRNGLQALPRSAQTL